MNNVNELNEEMNEEALEEMFLSGYEVMDEEDSIISDIDTSDYGDLDFD